MLPTGVIGPQSVAFDLGGEGPYVTVVDGFNGGLATQLSSGYKYLSGIDVESYSRHVYMTDASLTYDIRNITQPGFTPDSTGRLLKYDPYNQTVTVLLSGLSGVGGPTANIHRDCILVPESVNKTIIRYWLEGPKVGTTEEVSGWRSRVRASPWKFSF
nr:protein strictosidine synthase-like 11-like [Tanacetum cinerariifolium]